MSPPADPLRDVFTPEVLTRLRGRKAQTQALEERLRILEASGSEPEAIGPRAQRAAWDNYLLGAFALRMLDGPGAADLRSRLTSPDDDAFRGAMGECLAGWFLAGKLQLDVSPRPEGRAGHTLEFLVRHSTGEIRVEVKSPFRGRPLDGGAWVGDDADVLSTCLENANGQFATDVPNLLIIVPSIRIPVYRDRDKLLRAFYGEPMIVVPMDLETGGAAGPLDVEFHPTGHFLNRIVRDGKSAGRPLKPSGGPQFTRVGAVLSIEEVFRRGNPASVEHEALLVHNPYAAIPIAETIFESIPQCVRRDNEMVWSDGAGTFRAGSRSEE